MSYCIIQEDIASAMAKEMADEIDRELIELLIETFGKEDEQEHEDAWDRAMSIL